MSTMHVFGKILLLFVGCVCFNSFAEENHNQIKPNSSLLKSFKPDEKKFILVTSLYNEKNQQRIGEYIACLERNLNHPLIAHIHVVYEYILDDNSALLNYLLSKNISIDFVSVRPSYGSLFDLVNRLYAGQKIIISNADIYFNETLKLLDGYDLTNKFLALTRWNVKADGTLTPYFWAKYPKTYSQDTWIFQAPIKKFEDDSMFIGTCGCDSKIAFQAFSSGIKVLNPCNSIQCCHLHLSNVRNYNKCRQMNPEKEHYMGLLWGSL